MKVLIISHGDMARGMYSTLTNFFGATNLYWACVSLEKGTIGLIDTLNQYLEEWKDEQVVICSDLKGGSANQSAVNYITRPETYLISGMNLSLLLQLSMCQEVTKDSLNEMIQLAKEDMVLVNDCMVTAFDEDDE